MHIPKLYKNENLEEVRAFIKSNSFGMLVSTVDNRPWATHIPLELEEDENGEEVIYGHVSKANAQWKQFNEAEEVLLIFNGPHAYISSSWYSIEEVPTWNYVAVHIYGKLKIIDESELLYSLNKLVDKYETHSAHPIRMQDFSEKTMKQINGIVGFKITINEIQAAYKLSQNRKETDYKNIVSELESKDNPLEKETAAIMKARRK